MLRVLGSAKSHFRELPYGALRNPPNLNRVHQRQSGASRFSPRTSACACAGNACALHNNADHPGSLPLGIMFCRFLNRLPVCSRGSGKASPWRVLGPRESRAPFQNVAWSAVRRSVRCADACAATHLGTSVGKPKRQVCSFAKAYPGVLRSKKLFRWRAEAEGRAYPGLGVVGASVCRR